ncbi:putative glycosyltransferase family 55 protein [Diaporthe ampelina]|uniref:Putative glycosyltransferase family 55 protein n=1 Tax=Diaporthe ampelina TaxID=1214573 RepID=A0A0G2H382_9PEZI|nr:putative glycosyltransferase family 55 protein [Diaporthe ampelina]
MRFSVHKYTAHIGQVEIRGVQQVVEFEAKDRQPSRRTRHGQQPTEAVSPEAIDAIQCRTAIVVPCKDEPVSRIISVWAGIPAGSLIILVSASALDRYARERDALARFCRDTGRDGISAHQRDGQLAKALREIGMTRLLGDDGLVHEGKGEALVIGIALAAAAPGPGAADGADPSAHTRTHQQCHGHNRNGERNGRINDQEANVRCSHGCPRDTISGNGQQFRDACAARDSGTCRNKQSRGCAATDDCRTSYYKYIGFIDADNFVTGSVSEYCKAFSAGFHLSSAQDAMVRINWGSKPKVHNGKIVFKTSGRSSEVVNRHFNQLLGQLERRGSCTFSGEACERVENDQGDMELHHICTGNAGEHAMTMSLALKLQLAGGYAIEPFHFLDIFDRFAGERKVQSAPPSLMREPHSTISTLSSSPLPTPFSTSNCSSPISETNMATSVLPLPSGAAASSVNQRLPASNPEVPTVTSTPKVQILQIRTMNPHFHDTSKGEAHITRMWTQGLSAMYHSPLIADFDEFKDGLWEAILAGRVRIGGGTKYGSLPPTPPLTQYDPCSTSPPSGQGIAKTNRANLEPAEPRVYPAAEEFDLARLREILLRDSTLFWWSSDSKETTEDEDYIDCHIQDIASASGATGDEPAQETLPQRVIRRDSGVDFGMDGANQRGHTEDAVTGLGLGEPPTKKRQLDMIHMSIVTNNKQQ